MREHDKRSLCLCAVPLLLLSACASELSSDATNIEEPPEVSVVKQPLLDQPIDTLTFNLTADTSIVGGFGTTNRNYGTQKSLPVNRGLVMADSATLSSAWTPHGGDYIVSAKLRLSVNSGLISLPRILSAYRVTKPWTETALCVSDG